MLEPKDLEEALLLVAKAEQILIFTHQKPDGDAIASLLAMNEMIALVSNANCTLICSDGVPEVFRFLPGSKAIQTDFIENNADLIIVVDCGDAKRTAYVERIDHLRHIKIPLINIDHHPKNDLHRKANINLVDFEAASTTQVLSDICQYWAVPITPTLATLILTGLYTDTGNFQHPVTTSSVLNIASNALSRGAHIKEVQKNLIRTKTVAVLKLWGIVLERMKINKHGLAVSVVTQEDLDQTGALEEDTAGLVTMLEAASNCRVALLLVELSDGTLRGSIRSNNSKVDVSKIAALLGGGGHSRAAGFSCPGRLKLDGSEWKVI